MLDDFAVQVIRDHHLAVLGTVGADGEPQVCNFFYVVSPRTTLFFKALARSDHVKSFAHDHRAAAAIFRGNSTYRSRTGLQLKGEVRQLDTLDDVQWAVEAYSERFNGSREKFAPIDELLLPDAPAPLFEFIPVAFKAFDDDSARQDLAYISVSS